jgi:hypothetical protein
LALTKPANFFSLFADRDRYVYNAALEQYLWDGRYRIDAKKLTPLYGNDVSKASYINWIIDYNRQLGINSTDVLTSTLNNIDVRLCWRMAGFSGKNYLKVYTERATPDSTNTSLILPDESYQLLLYKNQPFEQLTYSSVVVQKTDTGYSVFGYSSLDPYFNILVSRPSGNFVNLSDNQNVIRVSLDHSTNVARVPYGFVFTNIGGVVDFLVSYGALLQNQGFVFENRENGYVLNWLQMADWDFILAIGDDKTDEDMFRVLPLNAFSVKIGMENSEAKYHLANTLEVRDFLSQLSNLSESADN